MSKNRMEAFSDGVLAIIITIMVLELAIPHEADLVALLSLIPFVTGWMGENQFAPWPVDRENAGIGKSQPWISATRLSGCV